MAKTTKKIKKFRDADTGHYVTEDYAKKNPKTTVREIDKIQVKPKPKKSDISSL